MTERPHVGSISLSPSRRHAAEVYGDTWTPAWASDDSVYVIADDSHGPECTSSNLALYRLSGDPNALELDAINCMSDYGPAESRGPFWKANGLIAIDGILYMTVSQHVWPEPDPLQRARDASIIKSSDYGRTWTNHFGITNATGAAPPWPMFPGRNFSTPIFVDHGRDGSTDTRDEYVYAVSTDGFWDNGNYLTLGRVRRELLGNLRASDWEFVKDFALLRADPQDPRAWDSDHQNAVPMPEVSVPRETSMTGIHYLSALNTYLLPQWYHAEGNWFWKFFAGETPWGPWEPIPFSEDSLYFDPSNPFRYCWRGGEDFYNPTIPTKFVDTSSTSLTILTAGTPGQDPYYHLYSVPATLAVVA